MANRKPIALLTGGDYSEMPAGDFVDPACVAYPWTEVEVTSDFTVNNTALSPTGWSGISLLASSKYEFEIIGAVSGSTLATGWRFGTSAIPSGATSWWTANAPYSTDANGRVFTGSGTTIHAGSGLAANATVYPFTVKGQIIVTTAGNITFAWTGSVANVLTIKAGTMLKYRKR